MTPTSSNVYHVQTINNYYYSAPPPTMPVCNCHQNHQNTYNYPTHPFQSMSTNSVPYIPLSSFQSQSNQMRPSTLGTVGSLNDVLSSLEGQMESLVFQDVMRRANVNNTLSREDRLRNQMFEQLQRYQPPDWRSMTIMSSYETDAGVPDSLSLHEIAKLPTCRCNNPDETCCICTDFMTVGEQMRVLPCNHRFHMQCSMQWLLQNNTCPLCRHEITFDDDEDIEEPPSIETTEEEEDKTKILIETTEENSSNSPNKK